MLRLVEFDAPIPISPTMSSRFPTPIGGTPLPVDFAPSIFFAVLYGVLSPLVFFRMLDRRSRTVLLIGTAAFAIERFALFPYDIVDDLTYTDNAITE